MTARRPRFKNVSEFVTDETMVEGRFPHCLHGGACAREEFEVKDKSVAFAASGGERFALVLEFEFLSRIIASMQSMSRCRHERRVAQMRSSAHKVLNGSAPEPAAYPHLWLTSLTSRSPPACTSATSPMRTTITAIITEVSNRW
jgi:hypothetical protein